MHVIIVNLYVDIMYILTSMFILVLITWFDDTKDDCI